MPKETFCASFDCEDGCIEFGECLQWEGFEVRWKVFDCITDVVMCTLLVAFDVVGGGFGTGFLESGIVT